MAALPVHLAAVSLDLAKQPQQIIQKALPGQGRAQPVAVALQPRVCACSSAGRMALSGRPVRSLNRLSAKPSVRRSAFIMNSNAGSACATGWLVCTWLPCATPAR